MPWSKKPGLSDIYKIENRFNVAKNKRDESQSYLNFKKYVNSLFYVVKFARTVLWVEVHLLDGLVERLDEKTANDLSLLLGVRDTLQLAVESLRSVDGEQFAVADDRAQALLNLPTFVQSQQTRVNEDGAERLWDSLGNEASTNGRIHTCCEMINNKFTKIIVIVDNLNKHEIIKNVFRHDSDVPVSAKSKNKMV